MDQRAAPSTAVRIPSPHHFIGNRQVAPAGGQTIPVIDPSDGAVFAQLARGNAEDIDRAVAAAESARDGSWGKLAPVEKGRVLMRLAQRILDNQEELAQLEARDCGKPLKQARADAAACARYFEFYAGAPDKLHGDTIPYLPGYTVLTWREPHGVTGHIIPWNYPLQIFGRSVGGALAAGNACVVKPAEDACLSLLRVAELAAEAGLPPGALNIVTGYGAEAGMALARHPGIEHISFTGSPVTGSIVAQAGAARHCPVTLELGGKSPQIVFADADLDAALPVLVNAIIQNAGQTCSAGSRLLVQESIAEVLIAKLKDRLATIRVGDPLDKNTDVGAINSRAQLDKITELVAAGVAEGADLYQPACELPERGFFFRPSLFTNVAQSHRIAREEIFGPVLSTLTFRTPEEAIEKANNTPYGLSAGIWTDKGSRILMMVKRMKAGVVWADTFNKFDPTSPFGGYKESGYGREGGLHGLQAYVRLEDR